MDLIILVFGGPVGGGSNVGALDVAPCKMAIGSLFSSRLLSYQVSVVASSGCSLEYSWHRRQVGGHVTKCYQ